MKRGIGILTCLLVVGCGQQNTLTPTPSLKGDEAIASAGGESSSPSLPVREKASAQRVVTLTPGLTELMYAVGAEASLIATVEYADYPEAAKQIPRIGDAFRIDMEKLLALKPDLVLAWSSGTPVTTVQQIEALGLRIERLDVRSLSEVPASLLQIGALTGHVAQAQQAAHDFEQGIAALREQYAGRAPRSVFIEVNRQPLYTVNGQHVLSEVLQLCGGTNIFAGLNQLAPIVGVEAVLQKNPQVILATDGSLAQVRQDWQSWRQLAAVRAGHVFVVSPDTTTRASPRLLQGASAVCEALDRAR